MRTLWPVRSRRIPVARASLVDCRKVCLGFRDGTRVELDPASATARAMIALAAILIDG